MITLTPEQIEQFHHAAENAIHSYHGGDTNIGVRADELLALAEMAQENERLREALVQVAHEDTLEGECHYIARRALDGGA